MLCGFHERGIKPDVIMFADTGSEMPHTYEHVDLMRRKTIEWFGAELQIVRATFQGQFEGLEGKCLRLHELPGLAYGSRSCSIKFKGQPQDTALKRWATERNIPLPMTKAIGFDAGEPRRARPVSAAPDIFVPWYPLIEWNWYREECVEAIRRHGIPVPGKSSCFFCPAMKRHEIIALSKLNPDLFQRAVAIEQGAKTTTPRGLGGHGKFWEQIVKNENAQYKFEDFDVDEPCGCYDG